MHDNRDHATRRNFWHTIRRISLILGLIVAILTIISLTLGIINTGGTLFGFFSPNSPMPTSTTKLLSSPTTAPTAQSTATPTLQPTATPTSIPTPTPSPTPPPTHTTTPGALYDETAGPYGSGTFTNYMNAGGTPGKEIAAYGTVEVSCRVTGWQRSGSPSGDNWWYRVQSSPWSNQFYAYADNFYNNGQTSGNVNNGVLVDANVPLC